MIGLLKKADRSSIRFNWMRMRQEIHIHIEHVFKTIDVSTELLNIFKEMHTLFAFILSCCCFRFIAVPIGVMYEWVMHQNLGILFIVSFDASVSNRWVTGKLALWQYRRNKKYK